MDTPRWTPDLSVGHDVLDEHHQTLFRLLAELDEGLLVPRDRDWLQAISRDLAAYTDYHFRTEEELLEAAGYPFLQFHRASHQAIAMRMHALLERLAEPAQETALAELRDFVADWLSHHIEIEDFEYKPFLAAPPS